LADFIASGFMSNGFLYAVLVFITNIGIIGSAKSFAGIILQG